MYSRLFLYFIRLVLSALFAGLFGVAFAQHRSNPYADWLKPYVKNYVKEDFGGLPQNLSVAQDARGLIYAANNDGVLEYDGVRWRKIVMDNEANCRSLATDSLGLVYVGGENEFGYLKTDSIGGTIYASLKQYLPDSLKNFDELIWRVYVTPSGVYFQANTKLFCWLPEEKRIQVYRAMPGGGEFHFSFSWNEELYVRQRGVGLLKCANDSLVLAPEGEKFAEEQIYFMLPHSANKALVGAFNLGLLLYDGKTFTPLETSARDYYVNSQPFHAAKVQDDFYAVATLGGGLIVIDKEGNFVKVFNQSNSDLASNEITSVFEDNQGNIWLTTSDGISVIDGFDMITHLEQIDDSRLRFIGMGDIGSTAFFATSLNLYYSDFQNSFSPVEGLTFRSFSNEIEQCWGIVDMGEEIIVSIFDEIHSVAKGGRQFLFGGLPVMKMEKSPADTNRVFLGLDNGLAAIYKSPAGWIQEPPIHDFNATTNSLAADAKGRLWASFRADNHLFRIDYINGKPAPKYKTYTFEATNENHSDNYVYILDGKVYVSNESGFWEYDENKDDFIRSELLGPSFSTGKHTITALEKDARGYLWVASYFGDSNNDKIWAFKYNDGKYVQAPHGIGRAGMFFSLFMHSDENDVLWIGCDKGLIRYDHRKFEHDVNNFRTAIRQVQINGKEVVYAGAPLSVHFEDKPQKAQLFDISLPYSNNNLRFYCATTAYDSPESNQYQYQLVGLNDEWSEWTTETYRDFTNLGEGDYTFKVRSRDIYGNVSKPAAYNFTILPPWYRTWWAYLLYLIVFGGAIYGVFQWRLAAIQRQNRELEEKVEERTLEVRNKNKQLEEKNEEISSRNEEILAQRDKILLINQDLSSANEEISKQKDEIEHKNQEIMDSILYARRIQESILPSTDDILESFPNSFVLYKPKDIVSGDFYWFTNVIDDQPIISAVDCTGHGIPGAFMSVMGSSLLNQIVNERRVSEPSEILNNLNHLVQINLHQIDPNSDSKDGMDMNLVVHDRNANQLRFAGANNPLYFIRDGELTDMKVNKFPIGGGQYSDRHFETQVIDLQPGDTAYIFSDGFPDQFGGPRGRKFMYGKFKKLLVKINEMSMPEQRAFLDETIENWMREGDHEQIDDILVIGLRF